FIGLFGTVWGIMSSFHQIGIQMNANLATVAPGIAEALIATALGLFAAIPAVIFYNLLLNKVKVMIVDMENFINEFISVSENMN
ncbi:MAG: MotA/TolQ/ExbB proton channel family protein, partial [Candidatus Aminicenantes bacterium]|nr:MotA/TolQ/ExbB proton channel family protein [Candidatus Aminicenantes bacterium]